MDPALPREGEFIDLRLPLYSEVKGYWESELDNQAMKPVWTYLSLSIQSEPMDIIARSRKGEFMICTTSDGVYIMTKQHNMKWWQNVGGKKIEFEDSTPLHPSAVMQILVTDTGDKTPFYIMQGEENYQIFEVNPMTILVEVKFADTSRLGHIQFETGNPTLFWVSDYAPIFKRLLEVHDQFRKHEISQYLLSKSIDIDHAGDFISVYNLTPSVSANVKTQGRAPYSIDKAPRATRSATLKEEDEVYCISVAIIVLYTSNADGAYEKWSINRVVNDIFKKTKAYSLLSISRSHKDNAVTNQLRRWLPFCKELAKKTSFFSADEECPIFIAIQQKTDLRIKWMNKLAPGICKFIKEWISQGGKTDKILRSDFPSMVMKEWYGQNLKQINELTTPVMGTNKYHFRTAPSTSASTVVADDAADQEPAATNTTLSVIDHIRVQMLTNDGSEVEKKKLQRNFEVLAQNIVSHKRNFKSLVDTFEKVGAILTRMQTLETNIRKNLQDLANDAPADEEGSIGKMSQIIQTSLAAVEQDAKNEIRESMEPATPFLLRMKREGELDDFIAHMITYLEGDQEAQQ